MFSKAMFILTGNAFGSLMLLIRNLAVARLVSVEDYGIAATFAISMAIVEMASGLGLQQLIVQDKKGEDPTLQAGLQGFNVLRGIFSGVALFLLAHPIARFLGIPDVAWAYQVLALVPVIRGFEHFDIYRLNRSMEFGPLIMTKTLPALISVLSIWPLYLIYGDYQVMLYAVLVHWVLTLATGHVMAKRAYQLRFTKAVMKKGLHFGWPLLINNIILFAVFQGDRLIVGRELGMEVLAVFSMGITFTLTPTLVSASSEQQFFLPQLSSARTDPARFTPLAIAVMQASFVSALLLVLGISLFGAPVVALLLGPKYAALTALLPGLAVWQACRALKVGNTIVALSLAQTSNAMLANGVRLLAFPAVWYVLWTGGALQQILWIVILGELCAYVVSLWLVKRRAALPLRPVLAPLSCVLLSFGIALLPAMVPQLDDWPGWVALLLATGLSLACMKHLHIYVKNRRLS